MTLTHTYTHTHTHAHWVGLLWANDQPIAETSTCETHNTKKRQTPMPTAGFKSAVPAKDRQQTDALDRTATGDGLL